MRHLEPTKPTICTVQAVICARSGFRGAEGKFVRSHEMGSLIECPESLWRSSATCYMPMSCEAVVSFLLAMFQRPVSLCCPLWPHRQRIRSGRARRSRIPERSSLQERVSTEKCGAGCKRSRPAALSDAKKEQKGSSLLWPHAHSCTRTNSRSTTEIWHTSSQTSLADEPWPASRARKRQLDDKPTAATCQPRWKQNS